MTKMTLTARKKGIGKACQRKDSCPSSSQTTEEQAMGKKSVRDPACMYGPSPHCLVPLRSKDGLVLLKDNESMATRWKEHYYELFNWDTTPEMEALEQLPQHSIKEGMGAPV